MGIVTGISFSGWKRLLLAAGAGLVAVAMAILVGVSQMLIVSAASGRIFDDVQAVPGPRPVLLLGCVRTLGGGYANPFFERRVEAAARLFREGKASAIIVSGDNHRRGYDEPTDMKEALVALGVPKEKVYCDYAGFRTLDSIVRAKKVFGQTRITIVSQRFHNERSLYLAQANGLDAVAYNAEDIKLEWALKTYVREAFARVKAVLDVNLLRTQPKFLGPPVRLDQPAQDAPAAASGT